MPMNTTSLNPPPFADKVLAQERSLWLFFGAASAWERAKALHERGFNNVLLLPPGEPPEAYDWSCVAGKGVLLVELAPTAPRLRQRLMDRLRAAGVREALLIPKPFAFSDVLMLNQSPKAGSYAHGC
jgi:hypothetical protein